MTRTPSLLFRVVAVATLAFAPLAAHEATAFAEGAQGNAAAAAQAPAGATTSTPGAAGAGAPGPAAGSGSGSSSGSDSSSGSGPGAKGPAAPAPGAPVAAAPLPAAKAAEVVAKVQAFYDRTTSFSSDFRQQYWVKAYNQRKSSRGTVTFTKPGKMDWFYAEPKDNRVVSDGVTIKVYEAGNKQMFEQPMGKSQYPAVLSFLTGEGKLADAFTFELYAGESMDFAGGYVLSGKPKTETPAYQRVLFYVDAATSQVRRVLIVDGQGNRNRFDFLNPKVNVAVDQARFKFSPPTGTTIVHP